MPWLACSLESLAEVYMQRTLGIIRIICARALTILWHCMSQLKLNMRPLNADAVVKDFIASPAALISDLAPDADLLDSCPDGLSLAAESLAIPHSSSRNIIMFGTLQTTPESTVGTVPRSAVKGSTFGSPKAVETLVVFADSHLLLCMTTRELWGTCSMC